MAAFQEEDPPFEQVTFNGIHPSVSLILGQAKTIALDVVAGMLHESLGIRLFEDVVRIRPKDNSEV